MPRLSKGTSGIDLAIEVNDISKSFRLYRDKRNTLKERFVKGRASRFSEFWAVRDVSFAVERGSTFGLVGHNGSGKSTVLKLLAGIYRPTSGSMIARGRISALLELGAGFHGELTGRENVYLNGAILGLSRRQIDDSMDRIIEFAGIGEFIDSPVKVYSSGMYVRLGFSVAVTADPEILIVDEIIAVGDEEFQRKCFDHLFELRKKGTTIVIVTHALGLVRDLCDQAVWLDHGRMRETGGARDVVDAYLRDVNAKEAEAVSESVVAGTGESADGRLSRLGSGEVRLKSLEYLDASGTTVAFLLCDEPGTVRLHYDAKEFIPDAVFGLGFTHESGIMVAGPNSGHGEPFQVRQGKGFVDFHVDRVPLYPGTYLVSIAIVHQGHTFDYVDRGFELRVRADTPPSGPGLVVMQGRWSIAGRALEVTSQEAPSR
jgi:lipopolysaccharide transport system ATP-binding protein